MRQLNNISVWTIGHSDRSIKRFLNLLQEHEIEGAGRRSQVSPSKVEQLKREKMEQWLGEHGIDYVWMGEELGGYRRGGYRAYMEMSSSKMA